MFRAKLLKPVKIFQIHVSVSVKRRVKDGILFVQLFFLKSSSTRIFVFSKFLVHLLKTVEKSEVQDQFRAIFFGFTNWRCIQIYNVHRTLSSFFFSLIYWHNVSSRIISITNHYQYQYRNYNINIKITINYKSISISLGRLSNIIPLEQIVEKKINRNSKRKILKMYMGSESARRP